MILYLGTHEIVREPEIRISRFTKDFYYGFYCTILFEQAKRWATRYPGTAYVCEYNYTENSDLKILKFEGMNEEWLDFIVDCRLGKSHSYDIVEGPMANDTIFNYVQDFVDGRISRKAFWSLAEFKRPTHQISFHTARALLHFSFIHEVEVHEE